MIGGLDPARLSAVSLLVVGSPTQAGRPTAAVVSWINSIPARQLRGMAFAAFDTRLDEDPLAAGELARAKAWASSLTKTRAMTAA